MKKFSVKAIAFVLASITIFFALNINASAVSESVYNTDNVLEVSGVTAEELKSVLKHNLIPLADTYVKAEKETGVNAIFIASISALESGWGRSSMASNMNNLFGYGKKVFNTKEESIMHVAWALKNNYLTEDGKYYNGLAVSDVEKYYCPTPVGEWSTLVSKIMTNMGDQINAVRKENERIKRELEKEKIKQVKKAEQQKQVIEEVVTQTVAVESRRLQNEKVQQKIDLLEQERILVAKNIKNIKNIVHKLVDIANNINIIE